MRNRVLVIVMALAIILAFPQESVAQWEEDLLVITVEGKVIGIPTDKVRPLSRATQGVRIINLEDKDRVCSIAKVRES